MKTFSYTFSNGKIKQDNHHIASTVKLKSDDKKIVLKVVLEKDILLSKGQ